MANEENGFLEYLNLQDGSELITKSELIAAVRESGLSVSDRQLTFYSSEGLIPKSVRVGSRAGAYPAIVAELLSWVLQAREGGVPIEALKELLPIWKHLVTARRQKRLDLGELEYIARQHVTSLEGSIALPRVVTDVMTGHICPHCQDEITIVYKDGRVQKINEPGATIGFAIARNVTDEDEEVKAHWFAATRLVLATPRNYSSDPTAIILGIPNNVALPPDPGSSDGESHAHMTDEREELLM